VLAKDRGIMIALDMWDSDVFFAYLCRISAFAMQRKIIHCCFLLAQASDVRLDRALLAMAFFLDTANLDPQIWDELVEYMYNIPSLDALPLAPAPIPFPAFFPLVCQCSESIDSKKLAPVNATIAQTLVEVPVALGGFTEYDTWSLCLL
jgi:hypothetical protein